MAGAGERAHEDLWGLRSEALVERDDEQILQSKFFDEPRFMRGGRKQTRRAIRTENARGMRIECQRHRSRSAFESIVHRAEQDSLVTEMHAVEDADRKRDRTGHI